MAHRYLPTNDGQVVHIGRAEAGVMGLPAARRHLAWVLEMAAHRHPLIAKDYAEDATDLQWAIAQAEAKSEAARAA